MKAKNTKTRRAWLWIVALVLLAAAGGYYAWRQSQAAAEAPAQSGAQTWTVRVGDLTVSATGSGTLAAGQTADLSFPTAGTAGEVYVDLGDQVVAGQVLAVMGEMDELELAVTNAELALKKAQEKLDELTTNATARLAQAQIDLGEAQAALAEAEDDLLHPGDPRCPESVTERYYWQLVSAQMEVDRWEPYLTIESQYNPQYILENLEPARRKRDLILMNYTYCQTYTAQEIARSEANLMQARANQAQAETVYQTLAGNNGIDPGEMAVAQAEVKSAALQLQLAKVVLEQATLVAPIDGTVTYLAGKTGDAVSTATFITLTDLSQSELVISIDEADLENIAVGCDAEVTFDAVDGQTFKGTVTRIAPALVSSQGYSAVEGWVALLGDLQVAGKPLPLGMGAAVDVTCNQASGVLLAPTEALHQADDGQYYVYVLAASGEREQRSVEVGLTTITYAEIRSGLQAGEQVVVSN